MIAVDGEEAERVFSIPFKADHVRSENVVRLETAPSHRVGRMNETRLGETNFQHAIANRIMKGEKGFVLALMSISIKSHEE